MADGLCDYKTLTQNLLKPNAPDLKGMCEVAYEHYMSLTGINKAYTVSIIDCSRLEPLAGISRELFDRYRTQIANVNPSRVQACYHTYFPPVPEGIISMIWRIFSTKAVCHRKI